MRASAAPRASGRSADAKSYSAYYYDGDPNGEGLFYGLRIDLPLEDTEHLSASLNDFSDCVEPVVETPSDGHGAAADGHGKAGDGHGETKSDGHGDGGGHGEKAPAADHGDAAPESAHGETPAAHGDHAAPDDPGLVTSTPEQDNVSMFSFAYIKSLIFGKGSTTAVAAEQHQPPAEEPAAAHGEAAAEGDAAAQHAPAAPAPEH